MRSPCNFAIICLLVGLPLIACGSKESEPTEKAVGEAVATAGADSKAERPGRDKNKDRGEATMTLGANPWQADRAKASLQGTTLTIRASQTEVQGKTVNRQELHLQLREFKGPGDYQTGVTGSRFIGVGIDGEAAAKSEESAEQAATAALADSKHLMLSQANVTITAASDTEVSGTFSWQPPAGMDKPAITNGTFRAPISK